MNSQTLWLLLPLPGFSERMRQGLKGISEKESVGYVIQKLRREGVYRVPEDIQHYRSSRPLLELIPVIRTAGEVHCYESWLRHCLSTEMAREMLVLTFRARMGRIDPERWRWLIRDEVEGETEFAEDEARTILKNTTERNICLNVPEAVKSSLEEKGCRVRTTELDRNLRPVDLLTRRIIREVRYGEKVSADDIVRLVKLHVKFTDLVLHRGFDDAYGEWARLFPTESLSTSISSDHQ